MKYLALFLILSLMNSCLPHEKNSEEEGLPEKNSEKTSYSEGKSLLLLELFSSEGCSSCPSADRLLSKLIQKAAQDNIPLYALKFHVDYWDRLGWKDIYASPAFTERQYQYARAFQSSQIYTPQLVINGEKEMVGSDEQAIEQAMKEELKKMDKQMPVLRVSYQADSRDLLIEYGLQSFSKDQVLNFALLEKEAVHQVKRGENEGRTLTHHHIVRQLESISPEKNEGSKTLHIPAELDKNQLILVAYLQDKNTMRIFGAAQVNLQDH